MQSTVRREGLYQEWIHESLLTDSESTSSVRLSEFDVDVFPEVVH